MVEELRKNFEEFIFKQAEKPSNSLLTREKVNTIKDYLLGSEFSYLHESNIYV